MAELLWFLGYPDQALEKSRAALALAQKLSHAFSMAFAFIFAAITHQFRGEGPIAQEQTEAAITLCKEQRFPVWLAYGTVLQGWVLANQQPSEAVITTIRKGIAAWRATGAEASLPLLLAMLAEAYGKAGQAKEGLTVLEEALAIAQKNHERYYEPELYRLKGELSLQSEVRSPESEVKTSLGQVKTSQDKSAVSDPRPLAPDPQSEAEACFHRAIAIAREQSTKSLELRAVMSLARLWQQQGKQHAARNILSEIYGWFTEGFETVDLQAAKSLLDQL
jgi:predicted ATPase